MPPATLLGATGREVTRVGLGGEGVLRTFGREAQAEAVITEALAAGITYFDSARAYAGSEAYLGAVWQARPEDRGRVFQTSKSAARDRAGAEADLKRSLANLHTDRLDLWQIHDVRTMAEARAIAGPGGALAAFLAARDKGLVRHVGVTGHADPAVLERCVREWPVDAVLLPVNPAEAVLGGFVDRVLPAAKDRGLAVIAMKVLGGGLFVQPGQGLSAGLLLRYALGRPVDVVIAGCKTPAEVRGLAEVLDAAGPLPEAETAALERVFLPVAGRAAYYREVF